MKFLIAIAFFITKITVALPLIETDTIPPPQSPGMLTGSTFVCVGDTSVYNSDVPISCQTNWYINNNPRSTSNGLLEVIWTEIGTFTITLDFECNSIIYPCDTLLVIVNDVPEIPSPIQGESSVCLLSTTTYTTEVVEGESFQWVVDDIVQGSDSATLLYNWTEPALHTIKVSAVNNCGTGNAEHLDVIVFELPIVNLGNDTSIIIGDTIMLDAGNPGSNYLWSTGETTRTIAVTQSGNYEVIVSNKCGNVSDDIYVDVIVGLNKYEETEKFIVIVSGNNIFINMPDTNIEKVQIWDLSGRLIIDSKKRPSYYLPEKGAYIIKTITDNEIVFNCKIVK